MGPWRQERPRVSLGSTFLTRLQVTFTPTKPRLKIQPLPGEILSYLRKTQTPGDFRDESAALQRALAPRAVPDSQELPQPPCPITPDLPKAQWEALGDTTGQESTFWAAGRPLPARNAAFLIREQGHL